MINYSIKKHNTATNVQEVKWQDSLNFDMVQIVLNWWHRAWLILLVGIIGLTGGYLYETFCVTPLYTSEVLLYVNSPSVRESDTNQYTDDNTKIVSQDKISLSKTLVQSYVIILNNRTTLTKIAKKTKIRGLKYSDISNMITAGAVNESEVLSVKVTSDDPELSAKVANAVVVVLPDRVNELIEGSSVRVVDSAIPNYTPVNKSKYKFPAIGFVGGCALVCGILTLFTVFDTKISDHEYLLRSLKIPLLAQIPEIREVSPKRRKRKNAISEPENEETENINTFVLGYYSYSVKDNTIVENG